MKLGISTLSIACTLALVGCGSGPISLEAGSGETGSDDADTSDTDDPQPLTCTDENGLVPGVLRIELSPVRAWMIEDGAEIELDLAGDDQAEYAVAAGVAAGDRIAIARIDGQYPEQHTIVHEFSRSSAELLWQRDLDGSISQMWLSEDGLLAGTASPYLPGERVGFVMSQDEAVDLPNHEPIAAPTLGHVAAFEVDMLGARQAVGWIDLDSNSWQPAMFAPLNVSASIGEDHHTLEYIAIVDNAPAFVLERPDEVETISLPIELVGAQSLYVTAMAGDYRIVQHNDPDTQAITHLRVDIDSDEAVIVNPEPPPGWSFFDCYQRQIAVDGGGRLYYELRNDAIADPWSYDVQANEWTQLGHDIALVDDINIAVPSPDVLLVRSMAQFQTYCPPTEWAEAPPDALVGDSQQLVRRDPALELVLPVYAWQVLIDDHQRCAAVAGEDGWEVWAIDGSDEVFDMGPGVGTFLWLD